MTPNTRSQSRAGCDVTFQPLLYGIGRRRGTFQNTPSSGSFLTLHSLRPENAAGHFCGEDTKERSTDGRSAQVCVPGSNPGRRVPLHRADFPVSPTVVCEARTRRRQRQEVRYEELTRDPLRHSSGAGRRGDSSTGRASAFQADGCGFDSRSPLCEPVRHGRDGGMSSDVAGNSRARHRLTLLNRHGFAQIPSRVCFRSNQREIGVAARQPSTTSGRRPYDPYCGTDTNRSSRPASPSLSFLSGGASSSFGFTATSRSLDDSIGNGIVTRGSTANAATMTACAVAYLLIVIAYAFFCSSSHSDAPDRTAPSGTAGAHLCWLQTPQCVTGETPHAAVPSLKAGRYGCVFSSQQRSERSQHLCPARRHDIRARATF